MKILRRILIGFVGGTVLLIGIAMIVLPGPAILVIPAGLAILGIEFAWARHWLKKVKEMMPGKKKPQDEQNPLKTPQINAVEKKY